MPQRRCVICGGNPPEKDSEGNEAHAYPKTEEEARIWQISMAAKGCCVESIQQECCVCVEHIPEFVKRAKKIGLRRASLATMCPYGGPPELPTPPEPDRPSVGVLLLNGASLPTYCATGQSCMDMQQVPMEEVDSEAKVTQRIHPMDSNTDIYVQESAFQDTGGTFPDIDGTEVTRLRTPMQEEEELERLQQELVQEEAEEEEDPSIRRRRNSCLPGCTDVLLLGRGPHPTDECPCQCEQCSKPSGVPDPKERPCCRPECCTEDQTALFTQPPCGCECELQVRRQLGKVIRTQNHRIKELEQLLCRQNNMRTCLQRKLDELYCEFGRLDEAEDDANRSRLTCPGRDRGAPDCVSVLEPHAESDERHGHHHGHHRRHRRSILLDRLLPGTKEKEPDEEEPKEEEVLAPSRDRVHWFAERNQDSVNVTRRPQWVNEDEPRHSKISFRLSDDARFPPQPKSRSNFTNPSYTASYSYTSNSHTSSNYSNVTNSKNSIGSRSNVTNSKNSIGSRSNVTNSKNSIGSRSNVNNSKNSIGSRSTISRA